MLFLSDALAQQMYAEQNYEYPIKQGVPWSGLLQSFGSYKADDLALATRRRAGAVRRCQLRRLLRRRRRLRRRVTAPHAEGKELSGAA